MLTRTRPAAEPASLEATAAGAPPARNGLEEGAPCRVRLDARVRVLRLLRGGPARVSRGTQESLPRAGCPELPSEAESHRSTDYAQGTSPAPFHPESPIHDGGGGHHVESSPTVRQAAGAAGDHQLHRLVGRLIRRRSASIDVATPATRIESITAPSGTRRSPSPDTDHRTAHEKSAEDAPEQQAVLVERRHREEAEDHRDHEDVVHAGGLLDDVAGQVLLRAVAAPFVSPSTASTVVPRPEHWPS